MIFQVNDSFGQMRIAKNTLLVSLFENKQLDHSNKGKLYHITCKHYGCDH